MPKGKANEALRKPNAGDAIAAVDKEPKKRSRRKMKLMTAKIMPKSLRATCVLTCLNFKYDVLTDCC